MEDGRDHEIYMEEMTKRIQEGDSLETPHQIFHPRSSFEEKMMGRIQANKSSLNIHEENPVICAYNEDPLLVQKLKYWLPSMSRFLLSNEFCPHLALIKFLATKSLAQEDSKSLIEYVKRNELVAWFVLFLFTKVTEEYKGYATLCLEYLVTTKMTTIYQKTTPEHLLHCVLTLPLTLEDNVEIVRQACCAIAFLCGCYTVTFTLVDGVKNQLLELTKLAKYKEHKYTLAWPALHAVHYIARDDQDFLAKIFEERSFLLKLLRRKHGNDDKGIIEESCWIVSIMVERYRDKFLKDDIGISFFPRIVKQSHFGDIHINKAAVVAISNATACATHHQIWKLVKMGCLEVLCSHLNYIIDDWILTCCLDGIERILQSGNLGAGRKNLYARAMDECLGWSALEDVEFLYDYEFDTALLSKALEIEKKYHLSEDEIIWSCDMPSSSECSTDEQDSECSTDEQEEDLNQNDSKKPRLDKT